MIDNHSVLGVILASGGSKGLPRKNVRDLAGKPLIAWTIEAGHESEYLDRLILSSDDDEIIAMSKEYGCEVPFRRPDALAEDDTSSIEALLHASDQVERHDYVVLLQPTSPLRTADDIDATIARCHETGAPACVTVTETDKPLQWMYTFGERNKLEPCDGSRRKGYTPTGGTDDLRAEWSSVRGWSRMDARARNLLHRRHCRASDATQAVGGCGYFD